MKKITFYTLADKRPDFIRMQYNSLKRYVLDEYEYVVINNAIDSYSRRREITDICNDLNIRCIEVKIDKKNLGKIGGERVFTWIKPKYRNPNLACAYPIMWAWNMMIDENKSGLFSLIDSDMFFCKEISFNSEVSDFAGAAIVQYRGPKMNRREADVTYLWNAFFIFDPEKIPHLNQMRWDCGNINGYGVDVGGFIHYWLAEHVDFKYRNMTEFAIYKFNEVGPDSYYLEATLNGNYHFSFVFDKNTKKWGDYKSYETNWQKGEHTLPHLPVGYEETLVQKIILYFEMYIMNKQNYPQPTILGFIEFQSDSSNPNPFMIHHKAGSGYLGLGDEYGRRKFQFIEGVLGL